MLKAVREAGALGDSLLLYDLDGLEDTLENLKASFPGRNWQHAIAVKANPLQSVLKLVVKLGLGLECASLEEVELSAHVGCPPGLIIYDSPCKTISDLERALALGVHINCDNIQELERVQQLIATTPETTSTIGLRINPLLGLGTIKELSVSDATSKFGVPLTEQNQLVIVQMLDRMDFVSCLHVHVGSQGCSLDMLAQGALTVVQLVDKLKRPEQITTIDIGGGLPTNFEQDQVVPSFAEYASVLRKKVPALFEENSRFRCLTEFGRSIHAKLGIAITKCEYVKKAATEDGLHIAVGHLGSDMFVRTCYVPSQFRLRVEVYSGSSLENKKGEVQEQLYNVVGPLCFGGDKVAEQVHLPTIQAGDFMVIRDAGANCLSLWSRHCSRLSPAVYGYSQDTSSVVCLRKQESLQQLLAFWE